MDMRKVGGAVLFYVLWTVARVWASDVTFTEITEQAGFGGIANCSWAFAWGDHDGDGDLDIMTVGHSQKTTESFDRFFINNGDMTFTDGTLAAGIVPQTGDPHGSGWADFDNDGDADLLIMHGTTKNKGTNDNEFYRNNGDGTFTDINDAAGTTYADYRNRSANWIDLNNDGLLDIFPAAKLNLDANEPDGVKGLGNLVLHNNGDGTFTDISVQSGLLLGDRGDEHHFTSAWADYDGDHDLDVFIGAKGFLMSNNGDETFTDVTAAAGIVLPNATTGVQSTGVAWGDYDNDGDMDLFMTALVGGLPHTLYRNDGDGTFTNVSAAAGVNPKLPAAATVFGDVDNDGDLDLYVVSAEFESGPNRLYRNNGDGTFTDIAAAAGAAGPPAPFDSQSFPFQGTDGGFVDVNDDGFLEIFSVYGESEANQPCEGPYIFLQNNTNDNHWLKVQPVGVQSNRDGIGAEIAIQTSDGKRQVQHYVGGQHYISQDRAPAHFGVGANTQIQSLEVRWPSGVVDHLVNLDADQTVVLDEGESTVPLSILTTTLPNGVIGTPYDAVVEATGGAAPYFFELVDGNLPEGLVLDTDGTLSGQPTTSGITALTLLVSDALGSSISVTLTIQIEAPQTDTVVVKSAVWNSGTLILVVRATSTSAPDAVLTLDGFGDMVYKATVMNYQKSVGGILANPGTVTVTSSEGGVATATVVTQP